MTDILSDSDALTVAEQVERDWKPMEFNDDSGPYELARKVKELLSRQRWVPVAPTTEGFYWCKYPMINNGEPTVLQVFKRPGHDYLAIDTGPTGFGKRDFTAVAKMGSAIWSGPLPQPPEPPKQEGL